MTCFLIGDYNILPKKEVHRSLQVVSCTAMLDSLWLIGVPEGRGPKGVSWTSFCFSAAAHYSLPSVYILVISIAS